MTEDEYKKILHILNNQDEDDILKKVMTANTELMEALYDLQEFMEEQGLTVAQFQDWKDKKDLRMYH